MWFCIYSFITATHIDCELSDVPASLVQLSSDAGFDPEALDRMSNAGLVLRDMLSVGFPTDAVCMYAGVRVTAIEPPDTPTLA